MMGLTYVKLLGTSGTQISSLIWPRSPPALLPTIAHRLDVLREAVFTSPSHFRPSALSHLSRYLHTGIGRVADVECMIVANDATVKGVSDKSLRGRRSGRRTGG